MSAMRDQTDRGGNVMGVGTSEFAFWGESLNSAPNVSRVGKAVRNVTQRSSRSRDDQ